MEQRLRHMGTWRKSQLRRTHRKIHEQSGGGEELQRQGASRGAKAYRALYSQHTRRRSTLVQAQQSEAASQIRRRRQRRRRLNSHECFRGVKASFQILGFKGGNAWLASEHFWWTQSFEFYFIIFPSTDKFLFSSHFIISFKHDLAC